MPSRKRAENRFPFCKVHGLVSGNPQRPGSTRNREQKMTKNHQNNHLYLAQNPSFFKKAGPERKEQTPSGSNTRELRFLNISADYKKIHQWLPDDLPTNPKTKGEKWPGKIWIIYPATDLEVTMDCWRLNNTITIVNTLFPSPLLHFTGLMRK